MLSTKPFPARPQSQPGAPGRTGAAAVPSPAGPFAPNPAPWQTPSAPAPVKLISPSPAVPTSGQPSSGRLSPTDSAVDQDIERPFRKIAFYFGLAALVVRFGVLPEVLYTITGVNTYLLYLTVAPATAACILTGGLRRTFRGSAPYWWMLYVGWMVISVPFSSWQGGSLDDLSGYIRTDLVFLVIAGGIAVQWNEIRLLFYTIAGAAVINLLTARFFADDTNGRISLVASGTIGNSNDLAAHLLLVLPFLLFIVLDSKRSLIIRVPLVMAIIYGINVILGTASRGALISLIAGLAFMLFFATPIQRALAISGGLVLSFVFMAVLPSATIQRLGNLFGEEHEEAKESGESRSYLFKTSLLYSYQHPLFGVGMGQFPNYEGKQRITEGKVGNWHETHCVFTEVSAEIGIPALIFFLGGIVAAVVPVLRVHTKARRMGNVEVKNACFCFLLGTFCYLVAVTFLSHAYSFYFPAMIGLAGTISYVANRKLEGRGAPIVPRPALAPRYA